MFRSVAVLSLAVVCHGVSAQIGGSTLITYNLANQHTYVVSPWDFPSDYHGARAYARSTSPTGGPAADPSVAGSTKWGHSTPVTNPSWR